MNNNDMSKFEKIYFMCIQIITILILSSKYAGLFYKQYGWLLLYTLCNVLLDIYFFKN